MIQMSADNIVVRAKRRSQLTLPADTPISPSTTDSSSITSIKSPTRAPASTLPASHLTWTSTSAEVTDRHGRDKRTDDPQKRLVVSDMIRDSADEALVSPRPIEPDSELDLSASLGDAVESRHGLQQRSNMHTRSHSASPARTVGKKDKIKRKVRHRGEERRKDRHKTGHKERADGGARTRKRSASHAAVESHTTTATATAKTEAELP
eukprot:CAMPEP_0177654752 /NCGR_PEP_ID=MMETSP0447-20121125/14522_1 /TAXON_ID=0 /ORGANISM="Stygamoeba regulata, Strain BSH-02190019" /LENGTH=207 /DNA_ID=CAMNT_0019158467 /DNA_START=81 /DNA_END=704 /DNA_ORIENTATION=+